MGVPGTMPKPGAFDAVAAVLAAGVRDRLFPAAVVEVGTRAGPLWRHAAGRLTYEPDAPAAVEDTVFDLASLTKVIATTSLVMRLVERRALALADRVAPRSRHWSG